MRKLIYAILITSLLALPCFSQKADADKEIARTQEFIAATQQQGNAKIDALKAYIKKFPETTSRWTRLAHYHLAVEHFQVKDYAGAVKYSDMTLALGSLSEGEEGRLYLIIANSYGIKSAPIFNKDKALEYAQKAVTFAQSKNLDDVLGEARKLKKQLSGPPPKKISPEQQIKMNYSDGDYSAAISYYQKLGDADKANPEIHKTYANALFKASRWDSVIKEFKTLLEKDKKGTYAFKIGEAYSQKGKNDKSFYSSAVDYYLDAHLLYKNENSANNAKIALSKAEYYLFEKYGFNDKIKKYNETLKKQQSSSMKNEDEIRDLKRELRKLERTIRREYEMEDLEPPRYITDKVKDLQKKIAAMESGVTPQADNEGKELQDERNRIKAELNDLLKKAKERLGM